MQVWLHSWSVAGAACLALGAAACSLSLDFGDECQSSADCGGGRVCEQGFCVASGGGADAPGGEGSADVDDVADDAPWTPPGPLLDGVCDRVYGPSGEAAFAPGAIRLGAIIPRTGPLDLLGGYLDQALQLAVDEINSVSGAARVTLVSCDSATDPEVSAASALHLADKVGVQAIIGAVSSEITLNLFNAVARPRGVMVLSPAATAPVVSTVPDDGLLWRLAPSSAGMGAAIGEYLRTQPDERIAIVHRDDPWGRGTRDALIASFCPAAEDPRCGEGALRVRSYRDVSIQDDFQQILGALGAFAPERVVLISYVQDGIGFCNAAASIGLKRFVFSDGARDPSFIDNVPDEELLCRAIGTSVVPPQGPVFDAFRQAFEARWGRPPVPYTPNTYDAVYLLTYATRAARAATGLDQPSGADLAATMSRLVSGAELPAGPTAFLSAVELFETDPSASMNFVGASGPVDFDLDTGDVLGDVEAWHFDLELGRPASLGVIYTKEGEYTAPSELPAKGPCATHLGPDR